MHILNRNVAGKKRSGWNILDVSRLLKTLQHPISKIQFEILYSNKLASCHYHPFSMYEQNTNFCTCITEKLYLNSQVTQSKVACPMRKSKA